MSYTLPTGRTAPVTGPHATRPRRMTGNPARASLKMRKYEVSSLGDDGNIEFLQQVGPALPVFEAAFSAFARGTLISTTQGPVAVEDLDPGMSIMTAEFGSQPLLWKGSMTLVANAPGCVPENTRLTRIMADAFGMGRPMPDLLAGPGARLLNRPAALRQRMGAGQVFTPARDFIDGFNVIEITPPAPVAVYHLGLPRHATITAAGLDVESMHPGPAFEREMGSTMMALFMTLFPHITHPREFGALAHPRTSSQDKESLDVA